jgi:uroporphyrinogen decarboxylase
MNARERLAAIGRGERVDRVPFMPTLLEHAARGIGRTPSECARDGGLLAAAHLDAYRRYAHDLVTVGIDIYNIEAEALGCAVRFQEDRSVPGIVSHPLRIGGPLGDLAFSLERGRTRLVIDAAAEVFDGVGREVPVSVAMCGPFSVAVELCGYDAWIGACLDEPDWAHGLLDALLGHQRDYADTILSRGLGITLFESWATPPLLSPGLYAAFAAPWETGLILHIRDAGAASAPLVIGGDTTAILDAMLATGTTLLVADYPVDATLFREKAVAHDIGLRGNLDPRLLESGPIETVLERVDTLLDAAGSYHRFILGTGVVSFDTPEANLLAVRRHLESVGDPAVGQRKDKGTARSVNWNG